MRTYYLSRIIEDNYLLIRFYKALESRYARHAKRYIKQKRRESSGYGWSLRELEEFGEIIAKCIRIKHHHKREKIIKDKSAIAQSYLILFSFVERERRFIKCIA